MLKQRRLSPYWLCQCLGWGAVIPYWFYYESRGGFALHWVVLSVFSQAGLQIFVTDQYRRFVHRHRWLARPLGQLLPLVFAAWIVLVTQYMLMAYTVFELRYDFSYFKNDTALGALAGGSRYHAIWLLAFHLYHYARQSANQRTAVAEAQLAKLTNELNPHFLFNALNSIHVLIPRNPGEAQAALEGFSELLRYQLYRSEAELVPLAEELDQLRQFADLNRLRLEEDFVFDLDLHVSPGKWQLPPMLLLPLLENAFKYCPKLGGKIRGSVDVTDERLHFTLTNNVAADIVATEASGIGLNNIRRRLDILYPAAYRLETKDADGDYTVNLHLPLTA